MKDWKEKVCSKSTSKWYKLVKNGAGGEVCKVCAGSGSYEASVQTEDWLSWVVGGLEDNKSCKMMDERCVMCGSGAGEDVEHLLVMCGEFARDRWALAYEVSRIVEVGEWQEEYGSVCKECKVALLLGKESK